MPKYFEFDVALAGAKPPVWRRFLLSADASFMDLHRAIQDACGWWNCHLFEFFKERPFGTTIAGLSDLDFDRADVPDAGDVPLSAWFGLQKGRKRKCVYVYDFGDSWAHTVRLKRVVELDEEFLRRLLDGRRAFPHEDCGGTTGYMRCSEFVLTGRDPWGEEGEELAQWLDGWHPDEFDLKQTRDRFDAESRPYGEDGVDNDDDWGWEGNWDKELGNQIDLLLESHPDLRDVVERLQEEIADSPEDAIKLELVAMALARGTAEPWTSLMPCRPPLGAWHCVGSIELWLQQLPRGVGWRCKGCGAQGLITAFLDGEAPIPEAPIRSAKDLLRMTISIDAWNDVCNVEEVADAELPILIGAGGVPEGVQLVGNRGQFAELQAMLRDQLGALRGKARQRLRQVADNIGELLSQT